ncbi:MAG: hypothetical protein ACK5LS_05875 [Propioniciclava sp.]
MGSTPAIIADLASRIQRMEGHAPQSRASLPVLDWLLPVLPDGLNGGGCYAVDGSAALATALLAAASAQGHWAAVVGIPDLGAEAAAAQGLDLSRTLLVPEPDEEWLTVMATLIDVVPIVLTRLPTRLAPQDAGRLEGRIRRQGSVLVVLIHDHQRWPRATATLQAGASTWAGLGRGRGGLAGRHLPVRVTERSGQTRETVVWQHGTRFDSTAPEPSPLDVAG